MTRPSTTFSRHFWLLCSAFGVASIADPVAAESIVSARVSAITGLRYDSNPFLLTGPSAESLSADLEVRPSVSLIERQGRVTLEGYYRRQEYFRRYNGTDSYGGTLTGDYRFSDRFSLTTTVSYVDAIVDAETLLNEVFIATAPTGGIGGLPGSGTPSTTPAPLPNLGVIDPALGDVALIGLRQRRSQLSFATALAYRPNIKDSWRFGVSGNRSSYPGSAVNISSYRSYGADAAYTRALSETSTVGAIVNFQQIDFDSGSQMSRIYTPQIQFRTRLERGWSLDASVGASIVEGGRGIGGGAETSLTFQLNGCHSGERSKACLGGTRSSTVSALNGIGPQTSVRLGYDYRFSERTTFNADASYNRVESRGGGPNGAAQAFAVADVGIRHILSRRVQMVASVAYQNRDVTNGTGRKNISGNIGLEFSLGDRR